MTSSTCFSSINEFSYLSHLPPEIRCLIWSYTLQPITQLISSYEIESIPNQAILDAVTTTPASISSANITEHTASHQVIPTALLVVTHQQYPSSIISIPSALHVCRESRTEALRSYVLVTVSTPSPPARRGPSKHQSFYLNPEIDVLTLHGSVPYLLFAIQAWNLDRLRTLRCVTSGVDAPGILVDSVGDHLKALKRFELVVGCEEEGESGEEGEWFCMDFGFGRSFRGGGRFVWIEDGRQGIWGNN